MDRTACQRWRGYWSFPHARGDGPPRRAGGVLRLRFSPRAWGWTAFLRVDPASCGVFPTRVGMDRRGAVQQSPGVRFPHARGDGPLPAGDQAPLTLFSPRAWGWTVNAAVLEGDMVVFPTRVGMDRFLSPQINTPHSFPHARGDGPTRVPLPSHLAGFSPRAWGWTGFGKGVKLGSGVSPRAWGWTARPGPRRAAASVFPTRVGMDRPRPPPLRGGRRFPHARGDGPLAGVAAFAQGAFSPRAWGWTVGDVALVVQDVVFPTRVGMDRRVGVQVGHGQGFPHARGDGPPVYSVITGASAFSPRAWGWTVGTQHGSRNRVVFPTRVGMDRIWRPWG